MSNPTTVFIWSLDCESDRQSYSIANCPRRDDGARLGGTGGVSATSSTGAFGTRPPSRSCRRIRTFVPGAGGCGRPASESCCSARCGRWELQWSVYSSAAALGQLVADR